MGNFYVNHTVRSTDQAAVTKALTGRNAFVTPTNKGAAVIFDEASDSQDGTVMMALGSQLSRDLGCAVLAVLNHDDDIFWYGLFIGGQCIDEYDSTPDYFSGSQRAPEGGDAAKLCSAFESRNVVEVGEILGKSSGEDGYVFATQRHADLVRVLNLPDYLTRTRFCPAWCKQRRICEACPRNPEEVQQILSGART